MTTTVDDDDLMEYDSGDRFIVPPDGYLTSDAIEYAEDHDIELVFESFAHRARVLRRPGPEQLAQIGDAIAEGIFAELGRRAAADRAAYDPLPPQDATYVVTAHGSDRPGVVAGVSEVLADEEVNIVEIHQRVLAGMFALIILVDATDCALTLPQLRWQLQERMKRIGVELSIRRAVY